MSTENSNIKIQVLTQLEKYDDNVSQDEIDNGLAQPLEVIYREDETTISREMAISLGLISE